MADNVIRVNVTTVAPKSLTIQGSKEQNYINATGDTSGYNAQLAKNWAIGEGLIQNIDYSSKHYAGVAKERAELAGESLSNVQELVNGFGETAGNATNELIQVKNDAVVEISNLNTSVIEGIETASNEAIAGIEGARVSAVADVATNKNTAINEIKTIGNTALSSIETKGQEQIKNIEKTGFFMENDKLFFINSKGEVEEFSSGGGTLNMFDTILKDHILTYEESKGLALQGTYVYKDAIAGSRYGYSTFYNQCVKEFQNASNTQVYLSSNVNLVGSVVDTKGVLSGFSTANYALMPEAFAPASNPWEMVFKVTTGSDVTTDGRFISQTAQGYGQEVGIKSAKFTLRLSSVTTSNDIANAVTGSYTVVANTEYWVKLTFNGTQYILSYSLDGKNYTADITVSSTKTVFSSIMSIGVDVYNSGSPWLGTIDLNESYININGSRWWSGVDTVTRNPNGHLFYDINDKSIIDEYYIATGRAWFYGVDTENERIFLPRNNSYFRIGDESTVGSNQDAGLPNITGGLGTISGDSGGIKGIMNSGNAFGAFKGNTGTKKGFGDGSGTATQLVGVYLDASRSSKIYGNSDTVELDSVNMLLYICVGNTESEEALTDVIDITTTENDTIPLGYSTYQAGAQPSISWLKSAGQWNDGNVYTTFYNEFVQKIGQAFASGTVVEYTSEYTDYDLVINQTDMTFRLPLLDGSEDLPSGKYIDLTLGVSGDTYTAPANGWYYVSKKTGTANAYLGITNTTANLGSQDSKATTTADLTAEVEVKKGDAVSVTYSASGATNHFKFIYAQGNGSLYFKVANAVQNLELLNAGEVLEAVNNVVPKNRTVWDGQWVYSYLELGTSYGTYSLADYLPDDGFNYNVKFAFQCYESADVMTVKCATDIFPNTARVIYGGSYSRQNAQIFDMPVGTGRSISISGSYGDSSYFKVIGYRRLGTNT